MASRFHLLHAAALFPLRALVCAVGWFAYWMELLADWVVGARGATEYVRVGACRRCGRCCKCLGMELPERFVGRDLVLRIVHAWHDHVMNFEALGEADHLLVYRCRYYRDAVGERPAHCAIYPFRHRLCRFFPHQPLYGRPALHPDCGFRFVRREIVKRRKELSREGHPDFSSLVR